MNRPELLAYARTVPSTPAVRTLLQGIDESIAEANSAVTLMKTAISCIDVDGGNLREASNTVHYALKYEKAHAKLSILFLSLAQTLQGMGHKIDY